MLKSMIMTTCRLSFVVAMVCGAIVSLPVDAQEDAKPAKKPAPGVAQPFNLPDSIKLTDDQTKKLEELKKEATPKLEAAVKKVDDVLTKDQKKTRKTASDTAKAAGKKGKELKEAVNEALKLSDEQKASLAKAEKELADLQKATREQVVAMLTDEQKANLPTPAKKKAKAK